MRDKTDEQGADYLPGTKFIYDPKTKTVKVVEPRVVVDDHLSEPRDGGTNDIPEVNYADFLGIFGLPDDVKKGLDQYLRDPDRARARQRALTYVRSTSWYKATYPGIEEAFAKGIVGNEAEYRALLNQQNQLYRQYFGRDISGSEFAGHLGEGVSTDTLGRRFSGAAYVKANANDVQYLSGAFGEGRLSDAELKAYGEEKAGIDTPLGQLLDQKVAKAKERMQSVANSQLATRSFGRLAPASLGDTPDVGR